MVGAKGFEPPTFCSQSRRTTRLCNAPHTYLADAPTVQSLQSPQPPVRQHPESVAAAIERAMIINTRFIVFLLVRLVVGKITQHDSHVHYQHLVPQLASVRGPSMEYSGVLFLSFNPSFRGHNVRLPLLV